MKSEIRHTYSWLEEIEGSLYVFIALFKPFGQTKILKEKVG